mmetsp:Transcript_32369/g.52458  ORF Transcript_32369/g.52458 Transcript_32369/m.52458 type:complete len:259 (-) Transcript_32369:931-1707(-)
MFSWSDLSLRICFLKICSSRMYSMAGSSMLVWPSDIFSSPRRTVVFESMSLMMSRLFLVFSNCSRSSGLCFSRSTSRRNRWIICFHAPSPVFEPMMSTHCFSRRILNMMRQSSMEIECTSDWALPGSFSALPPVVGLDDLLSPPRLFGRTLLSNMSPRPLGTHIRVPSSRMIGLRLSTKKGATRNSSKNFSSSSRLSSHGSRCSWGILHVSRSSFWTSHLSSILRILTVERITRWSRWRARSTAAILLRAPLLAPPKK